MLTHADIVAYITSIFTYIFYYFVDNNKNWYICNEVSIHLIYHKAIRA